MPCADGESCGPRAHTHTHTHLDRQLGQSQNGYKTSDGQSFARCDLPLRAATAGGPRGPLGAPRAPLGLPRGPLGPLLSQPVRAGRIVQSFVRRLFYSHFGSDLIACLSVCVCVCVRVDRTTLHQHRALRHFCSKPVQPAATGFPRSRNTPQERKMGGKERKWEGREMLGWAQTHKMALVFGRGPRATWD